MDDPVAIIKQDHQEVGALFEQYQSAADADEKQRVFQQIAQGLGQHAEMEETILYPVMVQAFGADTVDQNMEEHTGMKQALGDLGAMSPGSEMDQKMQELISGVMGHVRLEEEDELPKLQAQLTADQLSDLGRRMTEFKQSSAYRPGTRGQTPTQ
jgi:hemerythrin superfamily protein